MYLGKRGYCVYKELISTEELRKIKEELTVRPNVKTFGFTKVSSFPVFIENARKIYLPRYYGIHRLGKGELPKCNEMPEGESISVPFKGSVRPNQEPPINACMKAFADPIHRGGILELPAGFGKTVIALNLITQLKAKTLILVNKEFLMNQWIDRIRQFIPDARIGKIQQKTFAIENKDIVVGMLQSIAYKSFDLTAFNWCRFVIIDEVHHLGSEVFSRALFKIGSKYQLGLSATPERPDGLTRVFKWHLGDIIYSAKPQQKGLECIVKVYRYTGQGKGFEQEKFTRTGEPSIPIMLTDIAANEQRNEFIIHCIQELVLENRKLLVLSERVAQCEELHEWFKDLQLPKLTSAVYLGKSTQTERDASVTANVIFGTTKLTSEGYDNPQLDTLVLACINGAPISTRKATEGTMVQTIGRIFRKTHTERNPIVVDIQDQFSVFRNQGYRRTNWYRKQGYNVKVFNVTAKGNTHELTSSSKEHIEPKSEPITTFMCDSD